MPFRRVRETKIWSLSLAVGVCGPSSSTREELTWPKNGCEDPCEAGSSSNPVDGETEKDREDEDGESTKPIPGVRGVLGPTGGRVASALFNRQERARTPIKRMTVPREI